MRKLFAFLTLVVGALSVLSPANAAYIGNGPFTMQGQGTAGSPTGGVLTVQPPSSGSTAFPASQSGNWVTRGVGNSGNTLDFPGQNAASPQAALLGGCQFNTSPTAVTSGNSTPLQCAAGGQLLSLVGGLAATGAALTGNPVLVAGSDGTNARSVATDTSGHPIVVNIDPCSSLAKTSVAISQTTSTQLFAGTSAKNNYICSIMALGADAENMSLVGGTGTVCATTTHAYIGGTTAAAGPNFAANGGFVAVAGNATVVRGTTTAENVCLLQSGTGRVAGWITYVQN